jgi:hypothetical protein
MQMVTGFFFTSLLTTTLFIAVVQMTLFEVLRITLNNQVS